MEKGFEDAFKDKFEGAELTPSDTVWNNIELELARAEGGDMKRRIIFFKLMAAASVTFAMIFSGATYYYSQQNLQEKDAQLMALNRSVDHVNSGALPVIESQKESIENQGQGSTSPIKTIEQSHQLFGNRSGENAQLVFRNDQVIKNDSGLVEGEMKQIQQGLIRRKRTVQLQSTATSISNLYQVNGPAPRLKPSSAMILNNDPVADPVAVMMAQLAEREKELQVDKNSDDDHVSREKLWAAVSVAAGGFNAVNPGVSGSSTASASSIAYQNVAQEQSASSGLAYSMGVSMGTQVASKWVIQGGVNYLTQTYDYTANTIATSDFRSFEASSLNTANQEDTKLLATAPYSVNNNMQYVSVPLQAGYLVVNKKVGVIINAGFSTDFFIRNTVTPSSSNLSRTSQSSGSESPYRPVNFSGLMGTELSYQLGKQYRLALTPGVRYPFSSIYKESTGVDATPVSFDVGVKFRYLFQ